MSADERAKEIRRRFALGLPLWDQDFPSYCQRMGYRPVCEEKADLIEEIRQLGRRTNPGAFEKRMAA